MKSAIGAIVVLGAILARADNYRVTVGSGGFVYNPSSVMVDPGDTVEFVVTGVTFPLPE